MGDLYKRFHTQSGRIGKAADSCAGVTGFESCMGERTDL